MVGRGLTQIIVLGAATISVDRILTARRGSVARRGRAYGGNRVAASIG